MCKANLDFLLGYVIEQLEETKNISEWKNEINQLLCNKRRLTVRELAFAFRVLEKKNKIDINRDSTYYTFQVPVVSITEAPQVLSL